MSGATVVRRKSRSAIRISKSCSAPLLMLLGVVGSGGAGLAGHLAAQEPPSVTIGPLEGPATGREGDALAFGVFVYGGDAPASFTWDFGDGTASVSAVGLSGIGHEFLKGDSTYTVTVDVQAGSATATRTLEVQIRNAPPRIDFLEVQPDPRLDEPVRFEARAVDPGGDEVTWTWDFGDGSEPRTGRDLSTVSHPYDESGSYTVTLTVSDGEAESSEQVTVFIGTDLVAQTSGAMDALLQGQSGATAAFAGMPFANSPVPRIGVGRTNDFCMVWMGFWDDEHKVHVSFLWTPEPDRLFTPGRYPVTDLRGGEELGANGVHVQFNYLGLPGSYETAKEQAASGKGETLANPMAALGHVLGNFRDMARMMQSGSGDNWMMYGRTGYIETTDVSEDRVEGRFQTSVQGPSLRAGEEKVVSLEGRFVFRPVVESTGTALQMCGGERPFTVQAHTPAPNERLVSFLEPGIEVTFTRAFRPETIDDRTVQVGFLNEAGEFEPIGGELAVDEEARTVRFTPAEPLHSMIYYRVRIQGGEAGVLSEGGEPLPDDSYEWRFATAPRNVPNARGTGGG